MDQNSGFILDGVYIFQTTYSLEIKKKKTDQKLNTKHFAI